MRLIDGDALYKRLQARHKISSGSARKAYENAIDDVCDAPTIDPVEHRQEYMLLPVLKRKVIADRFEKWCAETHAKNCPLNFVAFLYANDLLDLDKVYKKIDKWESAKKDADEVHLDRLHCEMLQECSCETRLMEK